MYFALLLVEKQEKSPTGAKSPWKSMRRGSDVERFLPKQKYHQAAYWIAMVTSPTGAKSPWKSMRRGSD